MIATEVKALGNTPLDEGVGEGYHRATNMTVQRCASVREPYVLGSTRHKYNLDKASSMINNYGEQGRDVLRFEWQEFKRILRTSQRREYTRVNLSDRIFFRRLYRLDGCDDNWAVMLGSLVRQRRIPTPASANAAMSISKRCWTNKLTTACPVPTQMRESKATYRVSRFSQCIMVRIDRNYCLHGIEARIQQTLLSQFVCSIWTYGSAVPVTILLHTSRQTRCL